VAALEELCAAYFEALGFRADSPAPTAAAPPSTCTRRAPRAPPFSQCRPWNAYRVGIKPVRELRRAMTSANVGEGVLVTSGKFTREARDFADEQRISLIDGDELLAKISALVPEKALALLKLATQGDFLTPTCPSCGIKMIPRKSTAHGRTYWGCRNYPGCKHTFYEAS
jgi:restriction system protein